jgi:hypothetical protein
MAAFQNRTALPAMSTPDDSVPAPCRRPLSWRLALAAAAALLGATPVAHADGATTRRLTLTIDGLRQGDLGPGPDRGRERLAQQLTLSVLLHSDGTPMPNNPLDPEDSRRQLERGQRTQQKVQSALAARSPAAMAAPAVDPRALQAQAQQLQARCGSDRDCLMREAMAMSARQTAGGDRAVQARLQAYGSAVQACERRAPAGAARDACIADARRQAGGGSDETDRDDAVETPYLYFRGQPGCQLDTSVKIDGRTEGTFEDVQGTVPFTKTVQAEQRQRLDERCPLVQVVLDTRNGRLWAHTALVVPAAPGRTVRSEKGRAPQRGDSPIDLQWREAADWLQQRLQRLNAAGEDRVRLPVPGGQNEVQLRWRFDPA